MHSASTSGGSTNTGSQKSEGMRRVLNQIEAISDRNKVCEVAITVIGVSDWTCVQLGMCIVKNVRLWVSLGEDVYGFKI